MKRTIPYGYEFRDGYIGVEKTASSVVRGIYIDYLNGKSFEVEDVWFKDAFYNGEI